MLQKMRDKKTRNKKSMSGLIRLLPLLIVLLMLPIYTYIALPIVEVRAAEQDIVISSAFPGEMVEAGDTATFPLTIRNMGTTSIDGRIRYTPFGEARAWDMRFEADGRDIHRVSIPPGGSRTVTLIVETTGDASVGEHRINVNFWDGHTRLFVMVTETREREPFAAEIRVGIPSKTITAGTRPVFEITIENLGEFDDTYKLRVDGLPYGWYARYIVPDTGVEVTGVFIRSGEQKTLDLEVIPPHDVEIGEYKFTSKIESSIELYGEELSLNVRGIVGMRVDFDRYRVEITAGDVASFEVSVGNHGRDVTLTNIRPEVSAPGGWRVDITPRTATSILPGERKVFNVDVIPPGDIVAGEYRLDMTVRSDQAEEEIEFRVVVEEGPFVAIFGIIILGLVVIGLWFMFKKFGRR